MSITTKQGDQGMTSLIGGQRVLKCDERVDAYGTVDELSAFIGVLHDSLPETESETKKDLMRVQKQLLVVEAVLACPEEGRIERLDPGALYSLESQIYKLEAELPQLRTFVIPGGNILASYCHVCRVVCRRAERMIVRTGKQGIELQYINRLSDYFFLLGRYYSR